MNSFGKQKIFILLLPLMFLLTGCNIPLVGNSGNTEDVELADALPPPASPTVDSDKQNNDNSANDKSDDVIQITDKTTFIDIDAGGRTSPFVPYKERNLTYSSLNFGDLPLPPMSGEPDENLTNLISAKVTGIIYDSSSPSAIINVLDEDYLVKAGDKVESFEISGIKKDYVAIKTGSNVYRAKVGDIIEGDVFGTGVYNLGHRFAGTRHPARKEDILIVTSTKKKSDTDTQKTQNFNEMSLPEIKLPKFKLKTQAGEVPLPTNNNATQQTTNNNVTPPTKSTN